MKQVIVQCKKIDEWDEETQKEIVEKHRDINVEYDSWDDFELEDCKEFLESVGFYDIEISYRGFWSQGDGASFTGRIDVEKWIETNITDGRYNRILKLLKSSWLEVYDNSIKRNGCYYYHERSTDVNVEIHFSSDIEEEEKYTNISRLIDELIQDIIISYRSYCCKIYRQLQEAYEHLTSDECVIETLRVNEYEFDKNGKIW